MALWSLPSGVVLDPLIVVTFPFSEISGGKNPESCPDYSRRYSALRGILAELEVT
jgi:hypothetical protein